MSRWRAVQKLIKINSFLKSSVYSLTHVEVYFFPPKCNVPCMAENLYYKYIYIHIYLN